MAKWSDPEVLDQVADLYRDLDDPTADLFDAAVERLAEYGPTLGRPTVGEVDLRDYPKDVKALFGSHLKELRAGNLRMLFIFGPDRVPVLLYAGNKAGEWHRWYGPAIREAARLYRAYLEDTGLG
jgi:hypothetical protein